MTLKPRFRRGFFIAVLFAAIARIYICPKIINMKISEDLKNQIIDWFESDQDFNTGLILLQQCIRNKAMIRNISRPNSHNQKKVAWELRKAAGLPENICQADKKQSKKKHSSQGSSGTPDDKKKCLHCGKLIEKYPLNNKLCGRCEFMAKVKTWPPVIQNIIKELGKLFIDRDILHHELTGLAEENNSANMAHRRDVLGKIRDIANRIEFLDRHKKDFLDKGIIPDDSVIFPKAETPAPVTKKTSIDDPHKRLTNLRASRTKKRNQLQYQSRKKLQEENPMPAGPKRDKIQAELAILEKEISNLEKQLV
jgi:hypothetical protein